MAFLRIAAIVALLTIPSALADAGNSRGRIPWLCLVVGIPHLIAGFAPTARNGASIGIAVGSSLLLFIGLTFNTLLSLITLFPVPGSSWPWLIAAIAHGLMFTAGIVAARGRPTRDGQVSVYGYIGFAYSIVSVILVQVFSRISF